MTWNLRYYKIGFHYIKLKYMRKVVCVYFPKIYNNCSYEIFKSEFHTESRAYILIPATVSRHLSTTTHDDINTVLTAFLGVFPVDLPTTIPPLRDIQNNIDIVPGTTLPN